MVTSTGTASTPLLFAGQYADAESGLLYLRARYYDPKTALFLTVDPLVDKTRAPYSYSGDNPLSFADPTGLDFWGSFGIGLAIGGAIIGGAACIILEPCGAAVAIAGGGVAIAGAGSLLGAAGIGAGAAVGLGAALYGASNSGGGGGSSGGDSHMIGENGTQLSSKTTWNKGPYRIDVENSAPGRRPGQMHFQDQSGKIPKCQYNFDTGEFEGIPRKLADKLAKDPSFQRGIQQGLKYLGE